MRPLIFSLVTLTAAVTVAGPASAMAPAEVFSRSVLLGFNHPVPDALHLVFVLVIGAAAALSGRLVSGTLSWLASMLLACLAIAALDETLPLRQVLIGVSVLTTGCLIASARRPSLATVAAVFAGFGLLQGAVFYGPIVAGAGAASPGAIGSYLIGFGATQALIAAAAAFLALRIHPVSVRLAGAALALSALLLAFEVAEAALLG
ncbi:HupE/UreJ family protein [uncultured Roseobacter sp.]|uniref:HupE/UreJ family protein n=1 Tax=uncultured Roseobacter sp. TaxID=114847 RepID=UPI00260B9225|nr:HupE/UreJ family protein [uncultured Roseobacter sp.]